MQCQCVMSNRDDGKNIFETIPHSFTYWHSQLITLDMAVQGKNIGTMILQCHCDFMEPVSFCLMKMFTFDCISIHISYSSVCLLVDHPCSLNRWTYDHEIWHEHPHILCRFLVVNTLLAHHPDHTTKMLRTGIGSHPGTEHTSSRTCSAPG